MSSKSSLKSSSSSSSACSLKPVAPYRRRDAMCESKYVTSQNDRIGFDLIEHPRYNIEKTLGSGGFGTVVLATDEVTGKRVAIKQLKKFSDASLEVAMLKYLKPSAANKCPASLPCYIAHFSTTMNDGAREYHIVQEIGPGMPLSKVFKQLKEPAGLLEYLQLMEALMRDTLRATLFLHRRKIVHGDIKPANIMFDPETRAAMLLDVGGSCILTDAAGFKNSCARSVAGTVAWMSPAYSKLWNAGEKNINHVETAMKNDAYALGLTYVTAASLGKNSYASKTVVENDWTAMIYDDVVAKSGRKLFDTKFAQIVIYMAVCMLANDSEKDRISVQQALRLVEYKKNNIDIAVMKTWDFDTKQQPSSSSAQPGVRQPSKKDSTTSVRGYTPTRGRSSVAKK